MPWGGHQEKGGIGRWKEEIGEGKRTRDGAPIGEGRWGGDLGRGAGKGKESREKKKPDKKES